MENPGLGGRVAEELEVWGWMGCPGWCEASQQLFKPSSSPFLTPRLSPLAPHAFYFYFYCEWSQTKYFISQIPSQL